MAGCGFTFIYIKQERGVKHGKTVAEGKKGLQYFESIDFFNLT